MPSTSGPVAPSDATPGLTPVLLAFAAVYFIWGSTYLAIRFAIETMPPFTMATVRFVVAGTLLYVWSRLNGAPAPTKAQWKGAAVCGALLLAGGNGGVVVAEQWVPSGLVALLVASVPLWLVLLDWLFGSKLRPSLTTTGGIVVGFGGVAFLAGSPGVGGGGRLEVIGTIIVLLASLAWAAGSLYSRYLPDPPRPRMLVAMQMLTGSVVLAVMAVMAGEVASIDVGAVSARSWAALLYLIVAGALVGYSAYIWLLRVVPPAKAGTYAYVNPVVAMLLGWAFADEPLTFRSLGAATIILGSVVVITLEAGRHRRLAANRGVRMDTPSSTR